MSEQDTEMVEKPLDSILPVIAAAVAEWKVENNPERIRKTVIDALNAQSTSITRQLLGFEKGWDSEWRVDHCNGRAGNTAVGDYFRQVQSQAIKEWLETVKMPELTPTFKKKLASEMRNEYESYLRSTARDLAIQVAKKDAATLVDQICSSDRLENYLKTMALIEPTT